MDEHKQKEIDHVTGVETTGHEWDGLKELNNPAPRWWLWVFYITIIWSIGYWIAFPAWPTISGATAGVLGWTQYNKLAADQAEITAHQSHYLERFQNASFDEIMNDPELYQFALAGGQAAFKDNCATCHGTGGGGYKGYPNLNDDDWLWGGSMEDIHFTLLHGARSDDPECRAALMPAFGAEGTLKREEIFAVADYVLALSGGKRQPSYDQGLAIFQQHCVSCHGPDGKGLRDVGAPNLTDQIWLYGGDRATLYETIYYSRRGVMPAWEQRLSPEIIKALTVYVHELGGGEPSTPPAAVMPVSVPAETPAPSVDHVNSPVSD
jgi:cytochrome c oxidase cbb3-type subunit 3